MDATDSFLISCLTKQSSGHLDTEMFPLKSTGGKRDGKGSDGVIIRDKPDTMLYSTLSG